MNISMRPLPAAFLPHVVMFHPLAVVVTKGGEPTEAGAVFHLRPLAGADVRAFRNMDLADPDLKRAGFVEKRPGLPKLRAIKYATEHLQSL